MVSRNNLLFLSLTVLALLVASFYVLNTSRTSDDVYAARKFKDDGPRGRLPAWIGYCEKDPNSNDATPPTIEVVNPEDGGTIPTQRLIDQDPSLRPHLQIIVRDNNIPLGQTAKAWFIKNDKGGGSLVPELESPYYTVEPNDWYAVPWHNFDAIVSPKSAGRKVKYTFGACDEAGNITYKEIFVTTAN